jgi:argininosuccinate lyase
MSELVQRYTSSVTFDQRMWKADIAGSLAHAEMLAAQGIIGADDRAAIERGMAQITQEIESGAFEWKLALEDVHLNIEARLTQLVGDAGKRLHTGRSRNDQVATDVRLWLRDEIDALQPLLAQMQRSLLDVAEKNVDTILPGFTHMQVAQPVSFAHHLLAYVAMFERDAQRLADVRKRVNLLPRTTRPGLRGQEDYGASRYTAPPSDSAYSSPAASSPNELSSETSNGSRRTSVALPPTTRRLQTRPLQ